MTFERYYTTYTTADLIGIARLIAWVEKNGTRPFYAREAEFAGATLVNLEHMGWVKRTGKQSTYIYHRFDNDKDEFVGHSIEWEPTLPTDERLRGFNDDISLLQTVLLYLTK